MPLALFFPLLLEMLIVVDKTVGFRHGVDDKEYAFSYSVLRVKHRTSYNLGTRAIDKMFEKSLKFCVKHSSRGKVQYLAFSHLMQNTNPVALK